MKSLARASGDKGQLFEASYNLLLTHEDKLYPGAFVASLTIPWGGARNDADGKGGYHLVWTRDMVESAMGLLAAGNTEAPVRALIYLASRQEEDGSFPQNFWVNGEPFRNGMQLDEIAFPALLAWRLHQLQLLGKFDPQVMVNRAAGFLLHSGPVTGEERWEEASGYSGNPHHWQPAVISDVSSSVRPDSYALRRRAKRNRGSVASLRAMPTSSEPTSRNGL